MLTDRDRRVAANLIEKLTRDSTPAAELELARAHLRAMMDRANISGEDLMRGGANAATGMGELIRLREQVGRAKRTISQLESQLREAQAELEKLRRAKAEELDRSIIPAYHKANDARRDDALRFAKEVWRHIRRARADGHQSLPEIAAYLNEQGIRTRQGGQWYPMSVKRIIDAVEEA